jgi:hypothetical protein
MRMAIEQKYQSGHETTMERRATERPRYTRWYFGEQHYVKKQKAPSGLAERGAKFQFN